MKRLVFAFVYIILIFSLIQCSGKRKLNPEKPYTQSSVRIYLENNKIKEGIVLKRVGDLLYYVDAESHKKDSINYRSIKSIHESESIYDFEGYAIPKADINKAKGMKKKLTYGGGGLILGTAVGTAVGISLIAAGVDFRVPVSMALFGVAGAWMFGAKGSDKDFEDATYEVRKQRYKVRSEKIKKKLKEEKKKLEQRSKQKRKIQQETNN